MTYLLDSDHISVLFRPAGAEYARLSARLDSLSKSDFALSTVSLHEQFLGCNGYLARARRPHEIVRGYAMIHQLIDVYCPAQILPFDAAAQAVFESFRSRRLRIGTMDLRIAAIAASNSLTLLTRNVTDFSRITDLPIQDWTTP